MALGAVTKPVVTEWILDNQKFASNIEKQAKLIRKEAKAERDLAMVAKSVGIELTKNETKLNKLSQSTAGLTRATSKLSGETKRLSRTTRAMTRGIGVAKLTMANFAAQALRDLVRGMSDAARETGVFIQAQANFTGDIEAARTATLGLVSDLDIMRAKNRLTTLGVKVSDKQFVAMLKHVQQLSSVMSIDMATALEKTTFGLSRQSQKLIDDIGVVMNVTKAQEQFAAKLGKTTAELTDQESAAAFVTESLIQMEEKAGKLATRMHSAADAYTRAKTSIGNAATTAFASLAKWRPFLRVMDNLAQAAKTFAKEMEMFTTGKVKTPQLRNFIVREMNKVMADLKKLGFDPHAAKPVVRKGAKGVQVGQWDRERALLEARDLIKKRDLLQKKLDVMSKDADLRRSVLAVEQKITAETEKQLKLAGLKAATAARGARVSGGVEKFFGFDRLDRRRKKKKQGPQFRLKGMDPSPAAPSMKETEEALSGGFFDGDKIRQQFTAINAESRAFIAATESAASKFTKSWDNAFKNVGGQMGNVMIPLLGNFAGGIFSAADAAIQGGDSFAMGMAKMTKSLLLGVAQQAAVLAIMETAKGFAAAATIVGVPQSVLHFKSAALFGAVAIGAGAAGLGLSAGIAAAGGGKSSSSSSGTSSSSQTSTQSFGAKTQDKRPQFIQVYLGDPSSRSAALLMTKEVHAISKMAI